MSISFNLKDPNTFASASLDKSVKVWSLASGSPNYSLEGKEGHEKGVNCVAYYPGGDKPYLITGSDDKTVKVWDYQTKACVQTLHGHLQYVSAVAYHPELPVLMSSSEDGTVRLYNSNTYSLIKQLSYGMDRCWTIACKPGSNDVALGFDEGSVIVKMGRESPAASMDTSGKILYAKQNEIWGANVKAKLEEQANDGESLQIARKELGRSEVYPQAVKHNQNGRLCSVVGDGEYTIYLTTGWRNKAFGDASEFVWGRGKGQYAIKERSLDPKIKIYTDFKETCAFRPDFTAEGIHGDGPLLGIRGRDSIAFYDWDNAIFITQIDGIACKEVFWSENGEHVVIAGESSFYKLRYNKDMVSQMLENNQPIPDEGLENAFEDAEEVLEKIRTGVWTRDCFIYTNSSNKLNYCVGSVTETLSHLDRSLYLLGYLPKYNKVVLIDKAHAIVSYTLDLSVVEYQTAVLRRDFETAQQILPQIPEKDKTRVAQFLEAQGHKKQALKITTDPDHKFELALALGDLKYAHDLAEQDPDGEHKWKQLADIALTTWQFGLAEKAMWKSQDLSGLLLLYTSIGNPKGLEKLGGEALESGRYNIGFMCLLLLGRINGCIDLLVKAKRLPEAAFMARSYAPSRVSGVLAEWKKDLAKTNSKIAKSLADPSEYPNLFPLHQEALQAEQQFYKEDPTIDHLNPAGAYPTFEGHLDRDLIAALKDLLQDSAQQQQLEEGGGQSGSTPSSLSTSGVDQKPNSEEVREAPQAEQPQEPVVQTQTTVEEGQEAAGATPAGTD